MVQSQGNGNHDQGTEKPVGYDPIYLIGNVKTVIIILMGDNALPDDRFDIPVTMIGNNGLRIGIQGCLQVVGYAIYDLF